MVKIKWVLITNPEELHKPVLSIIWLKFEKQKKSFKNTWQFYNYELLLSDGSRPVSWMSDYTVLKNLGTQPKDKEPLIIHYFTQKYGKPPHGLRGVWANLRRLD